MGSNVSYTVVVEKTYSTTVEVNALTETEAMEKARSLDGVIRACCVQLDFEEDECE